MSASTEAVEQPGVFPLKLAFVAKLMQFRRVLAQQLGCTHDRLVFDDINDVHCAHCGQDFTD